MSDIDHTYDDGEDFDAADNGDDTVPDGLAGELEAVQLEQLAAAGFVEEGAV